MPTYPKSIVQHLDENPGHGTRYHLVVSIVDGVLTIAWPDRAWSCGDFAVQHRPEWPWLTGHGLRRSDAEAIADIVADWLTVVQI